MSDPSLDMRPTDWPAHLYKYRPLLTETDLARAKSIIDGYLYAASRADFNDPYDCAPVLDIKADKNLQSFLNKATAAQEPRMSRQDRRRATARTLKVAKKKGATQLFAPSINKYIDGIGLISFAEEPNNLLMWGHYGSQHAGLCFRFSTYKWPVRARPYPISYQDARPVFNYGAEGASMLEIIFLAKATCWKYEREWRVVDRSGPGLKRYGPEAMDAIVFGARVQPSLRDEIIRYVQATRSAPVEFLQARLDERSYDITISPQ